MNKKQFTKYLVINLLIAIIISYLIISYIASAFKINGNSMCPTLCDYDRVIISRISLKFKEISRFDIVTLYKPNEPDKSVIKRIIGLPDEIIEIRDGNVYINYKPLEEPFLKDSKKDFIYRSINMKPILIPRGHYFVLGDNREYSVDSRHFGVVPEKYIYGIVVLRYWPFSKFGSIK